MANHGIHKYKGVDFFENVGEEIEVKDDHSDPRNPSYSVRFVNEAAWVDSMDDDDIEWG